MSNVEAMAFPGQGVIEEKVTATASQPVATKQVDSSYPFNDVHVAEWSRVVKDLDTNNALARSWARMLDRGILLGSPTGAVYDNSFQDFQFARGSASSDGKTVVFFDARGIVGTESGL